MSPQSRSSRRPSTARCTAQLRPISPSPPRKVTCGTRTQPQVGQHLVGPGLRGPRAPGPSAGGTARPAGRARASWPWSGIGLGVSSPRLERGSDSRRRALMLPGLVDVALPERRRSSRRSAAPTQWVATPTTPTAPTASRAGSGRRRRCRARSPTGASATSRAEPATSAAASLTATMFGTSREQADSVVVGDLAAGADRDVVEHHRQVGGLGDGPEVGLDAGLGRAVVVRRDGQDAGHAAPRPPWSARSSGAVSLVPAPAMTGTVTASATARHRSSCSSSVSIGASPVVPATTRPSLPARPASGPGGGAVEVERAVVVERRDHRGEHRAEAARDRLMLSLPRSMPSVARRSSCSSNHTVWYESISGLVNQSCSPASTLVEGRRQPGPVAAEAVEGTASSSQTGCTASSISPQPLDDPLVVGGVAVVVGDLLAVDRAQLPVGAHPEQLLVDARKPR